MTKTQKLEQALAWALNNGIKGFDYGSGPEFRNSGCGCCSREESVPEEFRDVVIKAMAQPASESNS